MPKFGRFSSGDEEPYETYEGDYMKRDKNFVDIKKKVGALPGDYDTLVVTISLRDGETVRTLS